MAVQKARDGRSPLNRCGNQAKILYSDAAAIFRQAVSLARTKHRAAEIADGKAGVTGWVPTVGRTVRCSAKGCVAVSSAVPGNDAAVCAS